MDRKKWIIICIPIIIISILVFLFFSNNSNNSNLSSSNDNYNSSNLDTSNTINNYQVNKTSVSTNINTANNTSTPESQSNATSVPSSESTTETVISSFSTKIYSKDSSRQNNILITCNTLSGTIVESGAIFSFCNTVGQSTTSKGYEKADIFDSNGNKKKGLGGGNCQVSTTLYNAVLAVPDLIITERHKHSNYVPYIESGKDAAVAYGSYDLKFKNTSAKTIRVDAEATESAVNINIVSL